MNPATVSAQPVARAAPALSPAKGLLMLLAIAVLVALFLGLSLAYAMHTLPPLLGGAGWAIAIGALLMVIYCQVMGWLPIAINMATMLFLTVGTIPAVQQHADLAGAFAGLILGILFMAVIVVGGDWTMRKLAKRST